MGGCKLLGHTFRKAKQCLWKKEHEMNVKDMKSKKENVCLGLLTLWWRLIQHKWCVNWNDKKLITIKNLAVLAHKLKHFSRSFRSFHSTCWAEEIWEICTFQDIYRPTTEGINKKAQKFKTLNNHLVIHPHSCWQSTFLKKKLSIFF